MLQSLGEVKNSVLQAEDGEIGRCKDFLFDDGRWVIRYMVADTGKWLPGRKVLVSPASIGRPRPSEGRLPVKVTRDQIEKSPPLQVTEPVTREYEERWHDYYGWPYYWAGPGLWGTYPGPGAVYSEPGATRGYYLARNPKARNLTSAAEVTGFYVLATDGDIGHVEDFILDDEDWTIRYLVVDTRNWLPGKKVLVSTNWFSDVRWDDKQVKVELTKERVESSPEYSPQILNREYEDRIHRHYEMAPYWERDV